MIYKKIHLEPDKKIWFSSDFHYGHKNICRGISRWTGDLSNCTRDFDTLKLMNQTIVDNINNYIKEDDVLYFLGDWAFGGIENVHKFRQQINCQEIHFICGNHDKHVANNNVYNGLETQYLFNSVQSYMELTVTSNVEPTVTICLNHFPIASWHKAHKYYHLFGHVHGQFENVGKSIDVGIDNIFKLTGEYRPVELYEIIKIIDEKK